ncbi:synaptonemal complex central element protein 1 isoform X1 [Micropterus dolomieu]|uniref:synaptonemal complex central element protein 1 isoform X1 n=1 Tax=Micropterus dolomieu TaxID=147949 RepID=UPI001E8EE163|nr:synaptonemal complex central element protein 1 isoform X1 [Micropterus dolomieu]
MSETAGLNIDDLVFCTLLKEGGVHEPKVEQLMGKLRRLQQGKRALEEEIKEIKSVSDSLQQELETLQTEAYELEGIHKEKEEVCRKLQFQCEESEQDCARLLKQNRKSDELLEQYKCEIQEFKLKHRKQRMRFENQLYQLIEQHKNLHSVFTPERLPDEIESAVTTKSQLLSAEQMKLAQLHRLAEELEEVKKQKQTAAETQDE